MKKKALHILSILTILAALALPSCDLLENCGECTLVTVDLEGNITYGTPQFVCGDTYEDYKNSGITQTIDGEQYWDCD